MKKSFILSLCLINMISFTSENSLLLSPKDRLNLRSLCRLFKGMYPEPTRLYDTYGSKYLAKECVLLDCVYKNKLRETQWLLDSAIHPNIYFLTSCYNNSYDFLTCNSIARNPEMAELLDQNNVSEEYKVSDINIHLCLIGNKANDINIDLCLTACTGNINEFEEIFHDKSDQAKKKKSIPLVIWAATKNVDIDFLKNLQKNPEYQKYMLCQSDKYLRFACIGIPFNSFPGVPELPSEYSLNNEHVKKIETLLESNCFDITKRNYDCQSTRGMHCLDYLKGIKDESYGHPSYGILQRLCDCTEKHYEKEIEKKIARSIMRIGASGICGVVGLYLVYKLLNYIDAE